MQISPYLRSWTKNKYGKCALVMRVNIGNNRAFTKPIAWIPASWWDEENKVVRAKVAGKKNEDASKINVSVNAVRLKLQMYAEQNPSFSPRQIVKGFLLIRSEYDVHMELAGITLFAYIKQRIEKGLAGKIKDRRTSLPLGRDTIRGWNTSLVRLQAYAEKYGEFSWEHINRNLYEKLIDFLRLEYRTVKGTHLRENSIGSTIKNLKAFVNAAMEEEIAGVPDISPRVLTSFKKPTEQVESEVLTHEQLMRLMSLDLQWHPSLDEERSRFMLAYNTLLRDSDTIEVGVGNILVMNEQRFVVKKQIKTSRPVVVPCTQQAFDIISAGVRAVDNVHRNRLIKELMQMAGFSDPRTHSQLVAGRMQTVTEPQWKLITTHTARRSAATQLYLWGEDIGDIQHWGGWATAKQAEEYIKAKLWRQARDISKRGTFFKSSYLK